MSTFHVNDNMYTGPTTETFSMNTRTSLLTSVYNSNHAHVNINITIYSKIVTQSIDINGAYMHQFTGTSDKKIGEYITWFL